MNCVVRWADIKHEWEPFENVFCGSDWPFHLEHNVSHESLIRRFEEQEFSDPNNRVAFIYNDGEHVGIAVVHGLQDSTAEIDMRMAAKYRNQGIGSIALVKLTDLILNPKAPLSALRAVHEATILLCVVHLTLQVGFTRRIIEKLELPFRVSGAMSWDMR